MAVCSIVVPCFNERENLPSLIASIGEISSDTRFLFILVDNGSTDRTWDYLTSIEPMPKNIQVVRSPSNQGYGGGISIGLKAAHTAFVGWMHADMQTPPSVLRSIPVDFFESNFCMVKGKRLGRPVTDRLFTAGMSFFESVLFMTHLVDINGQPTILRREDVEKWPNPPTDFSLDLYAYVLAKSTHLEIKRIAVPFISRQHGQSTWNTGFIARLKFIQRTLRYSISLLRSRKR